MATAKKAAPAKTAAKAAPKAAAPKAAKTAAPKAAPVKAVKTAAKTAAPKAAAAAATLKPIKDQLTKKDLALKVAEVAGVEAKDTKKVLEALEAVIFASVGKKGAAAFTLPGIFKIAAVKSPARKARTGINPRTGEQIKIAAKPASLKVKVRALKKLKDAALA